MTEMCTIMTCERSFECMQLTACTVIIAKIVISFFASLVFYVVPIPSPLFFDYVLIIFTTCITATVKCVVLIS